jgi:hypothetical protein
MGEGMMDPPRLRSEDGTLEARLLRSARSLEPTATAEQEVWRRIEILTAAGAATGATGLAAQAAASVGPQVASKIAGKVLWLSWLKWATVLAIGIPTAGVATHFLTHRRTAGSAPTPAPVAIVETARPGPPVRLADSTPLVPLVPPSHTDSPLAPVAPTATASAPKPVTAARAGRAASRAESTPLEPRSALRAEALLLEGARAKLAASDFRGALDDVTQLGAQFPRGRLVQEREIVAIDSLAGLGARAALRERARAFLARFPDSPYAGHVRPLAEP